LAIRDGGAGDITKTHTAWTSKEATPDVCTPLVYKGKLFILDGDRQTLACLDPKTGKKKWRGNLKVRETFSASPTGADGKIYCISEQGTVVVLDAGEEFKIHSTLKMGEDDCRSSIVAASGQLFIRTGKNLWCIAKK
jgi:outer membrane protein assembly factor BamB